MFKLFGKKKEEAAKPAAPKNEELAQFAAQFDPEELDILAVTGAGAFGAVQQPGQELWQVSIALTAWMEEDSPDIHRDETALVMLADDQLREYLRQRTPSNFILKTKARLSLDGTRLLMLELPEPAFDPDLKAILNEQVKEVSVWVEDLGTFILNRSVNWFQTDVDWLGQSVQLTYDQGTEDEMRAAQDQAKALMAAQEDWDARVRAFAAEKLLDLANDWLQDGAQEGEEPQAVTAEQFMDALEPESIQLAPDGSFQFWFNGGELFWGHAIHVTGSLTGGPAEAQMEG